MSLPPLPLARPLARRAFARAIPALAAAALAYGTLRAGAATTVVAVTLRRPGR